MIETKRLRVYGMVRLRAADCNIISVLPNVNTQGPMYMIGEKGARMIREDWRHVDKMEHKGDGSYGMITSASLTGKMISSSNYQAFV